MLYFTTFQQIFFKTKEFDPNTATSGRIFLWEHNINIFMGSNFIRKLAGYGLGIGSSKVIGSHSEIWSSHNNYLHLLLQLGCIGLIGYILIYVFLLKDIYMAKIDGSTKFFFYGIVISIALMNFTGDVNVYGVGISQLFWMVMGFFYVYRDFSVNRSPSSDIKSERLTEYA
jgi:O-antigen ligase